MSLYMHNQRQIKKTSQLLKLFLVRSLVEMQVPMKMLQFYIQQETSLDQARLNILIKCIKLSFND